MEVTPTRITIMEIKNAKFNVNRYLYKRSYLYYSISSLLKSNQQNEVTQSWNPMSGNAVLDELATAEENFIAATPSWSFTPGLYEKWGKEGLTLAKNNMQMLADLCKKNEIKLTIIIYPWPLHISKGLVNDIQVNFWQQFSQANQVQFIDLYPVFINSGKEEYILNNNCVEKK